MSDNYSLNFFSSRACLVQINGQPGNGSTFLYAVDGFPQGQQTDGSLILIDSIQLGDTDAITPKDALNDTHAVYLFGPTFTEIIVTGTIYLGQVNSANSSKSSSLGLIQSWFNNNRVSKKKEPVNVSIASDNGFKGKVFFYTLSLGQADILANSVQFIMRGYAQPRK